MERKNKQRKKKEIEAMRWGGCLTAEGSWSHREGRKFLKWNALIVKSEELDSYQA